MMKRVKTYLLIGAAAIVTCCGTNLYLPTSQQIAHARATWDGVDSTYLFAGYDLYRAKCGGCHFLYRPTDYSQPVWDSIMPRMREKAKLNDQEYEHIRKYVLTLSEKLP